jgi:CheY-like chemotaxis protein
MTGSRTPNTRLRVLIVDDYRDAADALAAFIEHVGHEVAVAYGGIEALAVADRFAPDMVFLDLNMPQMDGYAVARVLRQTWPGPLLLVAHSAQGMQPTSMPLLPQALTITCLSQPKPRLCLR